MSSFSGLSTALSSLQAQRKRMDLAAQNIANANTPGYTRQRADLSSLDPAVYTSMHGKPRNVGDGVTVEKITRIMDQFALNRVRIHESSSGYYNQMDNTLNEIEKRINEPGEDGLTAIMGDFFSAFGDVANRPGDPASRMALLQKARGVTESLKLADDGIATQWDQTKQRGESYINTINEAASAIGQLNKDIREGTFIGHPVSELQDKRDTLINTLTKIAGVEVTTHLDGSGKPDGQLDISLGGESLVNGSNVQTVVLTPAANLAAAKGGDTSALEVGGNVTTTTKGELGATFHALNTTLVDVSNKHDEVANNLVTKVNGIHTTGFDADGVAGGNFFNGTTAGDISVAITDHKKLATSIAAAEPFNGDRANELSLLATNADGPVSKWQEVVGDIGVLASGTTVRKNAANFQLDDAREILDSVAGVDIDEEMTNLLATQRAYQAASRVMTAVDEALDRIINRTGRVGL